MAAFWRTVKRAPGDRRADTLYGYARVRTGQSLIARRRAARCWLRHSIPRRSAALERGAAFKSLHDSCAGTTTASRLMLTVSGAWQSLSAS